MCAQRCQRQPWPTLVAVFQFRRAADVPGDVEARRPRSSLVPNGNTVGRLYPEQCNYQVNDQQQTVTLSFAALVQLGRQLPAASGSRLPPVSSTAWISTWPKTPSTSGPNPEAFPLVPEFKIAAIENQLVNWAAQGPRGLHGDHVRRQIAQSQIASGFTVIHADSGDEFALGQLQPPMHPPKPFNLSSGNRYAFVNDTTEVRSDQIDMIGPFEVAESGQALFCRFRLTGPTLDALVLRRGTGDLWRRGLQLGAPLAPPPEAAPLAPPPEAPVMQFSAHPGHGTNAKRSRSARSVLHRARQQREGRQRESSLEPLGVVGGNTAVVAHVVELGEPTTLSSGWVRAMGKSED